MTYSHPCFDRVSDTSRLVHKPSTECDRGSQRGPAQSRPINRRYNDKQLTSAISKATTAEYLLQLACAYNGSLNPIHVAAFITKLATISKQYPEQAPASKPALAVRSAVARQQLLHQLQQKLREQECQGQTTRGLANIMWALAKLQCKPDPELLHVLIRNFYSQLPSAVPQDISNVLWGVAELTRSGCATTQSGTTNPSSPSKTAAAPSTTSGTTSCSKQRQTGARPPDEPTAALAHQPADEGVTTMQHDDSLSQYKHLCEQQEPDAQPNSSTCIDIELAAADQCTCNSCQQHLPQHQPAGQQLLSLVQVRHLLQQLCKSLETTEPQTIGNVSRALTVLQKCNKWCMCPCLPQIRAIMLTFAGCVQKALPDTVQRGIHCMSGLAAACTNHAGRSWIDWQPPLLSTMMSALLAQQRPLQQHIVLSVLKDVAQVGYLFLPYAAVKQLSTRDCYSAACVRLIVDKNTSSSACGGAQEQDASDFQLPPQQQQEHIDGAQLEVLQAGSSQNAHPEPAEAAGTSQHSDFTQADHATAVCTAAGSDVEELADDPLTTAAIKQLEGVGLLKHYKALRSRFTAGRISIMKQVEGCQVAAAAALPDVQLQYKPPTAEVLEQTTLPQRCQLQQPEDGGNKGALCAGGVSMDSYKVSQGGEHSWQRPRILHSYPMSETSGKLIPNMYRAADAPAVTEPLWVAPFWPSPQVVNSRGSRQGTYPDQQQPPSWQHRQRLYQQQRRQNPWQDRQARPQDGQPYARGSHQLVQLPQKEDLLRPGQQQQQQSGDGNDYLQQQRHTEQQDQQSDDLRDQNRHQRQHQQQLYHITQVQLSKPISHEAALQESPFAAAVTVAAAPADEQDNFARGQSTLEMLATTTESILSAPAITHCTVGIHKSSPAAGAGGTVRSGSSSQQSVLAIPDFVGCSSTVTSNATPPTQDLAGSQPAPAANSTLATVTSGSSRSMIALQLLAQQVSNDLGSQLGLTETAVGSAATTSRADASNQQTADEHAKVLKAGLKQLATSSNPAAAGAACINDDDTQLVGDSRGSQMVPSFEGKPFLVGVAAANSVRPSVELDLKLHATVVKPCAADSISNASSSARVQPPTKPAETSYSNRTGSQQQSHMIQQVQQQQQVHQRQPQQQQLVPRQLAYTAQELAAANLVHVQHAGGQVQSYRQMPDGLLIPVHVDLGKTKQLQHQHDPEGTTGTLQAGLADITKNTLQQQQLLQQQPQQKLFKHSSAPDAWLMQQQQQQQQGEVHSQLHVRALPGVVDVAATAASSTTAGVSHDMSASGLFPTAQQLLQQQQRQQQFAAKANMGVAHDPVTLLPGAGQDRQLRQQRSISFGGAQTAVPPVPGVPQQRQLQQQQFLLNRPSHTRFVTGADLHTQQGPNVSFHSLVTNAARPIRDGTFSAQAAAASVHNLQSTGGMLEYASMQQPALQSSISEQLGMSALAGPVTEFVQLPDTVPHGLGYDQAPLGLGWNSRVMNTELNVVPNSSLGLLGLGGDGMMLQVPSDYQQQQFVIQHQLSRGLTWPPGYTMPPGLYREPSAC